MHISRLIKILSEELNAKCKSIKSTVWNIAADCCVNESIHLKEIEIDKKLFPACLPELYNLPKNYSSEFYYYELLKNRKIKFFTESPNSHEGWISEIKSIEDLLSLARKTDSFTKDIIKESVKNFNKSRGHLPCGLEELIKEALKPPQLPYYQIIRKLVKASRFSKYRRSFTKLNRKRTYLFCIGDKNIPQLCPFPGKTKDFTFRISILLDTSGSMSLENVLEGLSGIRDIIEKDRNCFVNIIECDAKVQKEYQVKKLRDIQMGICGRGGTTLFPGLERCKELDSDIVLVFTDGFCDNINEIPKRLLPKKIVWVLTKNGSDNDINKTGVIVRLKK
jgi:predicted metal-dependent peptidase